MGQYNPPAVASEERTSESESPNEEFLLSERRLPRNSKPGEKQTRPPTTIYASWVQNWWLLEIVALLIGTISVIAICIVLRHYQDKPAPKANAIGGVGITLNTVISILITIGRASLLLAVTECISQQKWVWFSGSAKPLTELEVFDNGSRGAFGSLKLLWQFNVRQVVSVGAFLVIFGLAVDPLSQELLHYEVQPVADLSSGLAYVSTALTWVASGQTTNMYTWGQPEEQIQDPPLLMKAAVQNGILTSGSKINETLPYCATGNCTWPVYQSLAVCMRWQDISGHLSHSSFQDERNITQDKWSLTDRHYIETLSGAYPRLNMTSVGFVNAKDSLNATPLNFSDSIAFADSPSPLADVFLMYKNQSKPDGDPRPYDAFEVVLEWCAQEFSTSVVNGLVSTSRLGFTNNFTTDGRSYYTGPVFNTTTDFSYESVGAKYGVDYLAHNILSHYLRKILNGTVYVVGTDFYKTSDAAEAFYQRFDPQDSNNSPAVLGQPGLVDLLQNIATSMTNIVRQKDHTSVTAETSKAIYNMANGTAWRDQTFVRVQWGYVTAPVTLALLSILFVTVTIVQSGVQEKKYKIWKSSTISTLLALSDEAHLQIGGLRSTSENEKAVENVRVALRHDADAEWRLRSTGDI
ncbi:acid phosphatase protein [Rutstroemia sp. NJR-2017a BBW]|nr:acid phosphatase protein [Rutstroemia sp. NJR-2017a BBW]